jgi:hypothetical protein
MPSIIDPKKTKWRYFYRDVNGQIHITDEQSETPPNLNKVAFLTTSTYFSDKKVHPAQHMKNIVDDVLLNRGSNFCIALPIDDNHPMIYANNPIPDGCEAFADVVVYNRLNNGFEYVTAIKGAEQIASAIENGFHIVQMYGGFTIDQKIEFVREYFRENPLSQDHIKKLFVGFSNGSGAAFGLEELTQYVCGLGAGKIAGWPKEYQDVVDQSLKLLAAQEPYQITRFLSAGENFDVLQARFQEAQSNRQKIRHFTIWQRELLANNNSAYRYQQNPDEKLILSLEGFAQCEAGFNLHEVLYRALKTGSITPENTLCIVIENLMSNHEQQKNLRRINGRIPNYEDLTEGEKGIILNILASNNSFDLEVEGLSAQEKQKLIVDYIFRSNQASENEEQRIKAVAEMFGIPVIFGGEKRSGHAFEFVIQPTNVVSLEFDFNSRSIKETTAANICEQIQPVKQEFDVRSIQPITWPTDNFGVPFDEEDSIVCIGQKVVQTPCEYQKNASLEAQSEEKRKEISQFLSNLKLEPLRTGSVQEFSQFDNVEIVGGSALNIAEQKLEDLGGKGLLCMLQKPAERTCNSPLAYLELLINSGKISNTPFVIFSIAEDRPFAKLFAGELDRIKETMKDTLGRFGITTPIFFTTENLTNQDLPALFSV